MIDIHTHILPNVDDGSKDLETSISMIELEIEQGVTDIVLTPHVQSRVTKANTNKRKAQFEILKEEVSKRGLKINLHLGAEIMYHSHIETDYSKYAFGKNKYVLIEFSTKAETPIEEICFDVMAMGYQVIVAHIERYGYLSIADIEKIRSNGALIQVNASAILNKDPLASKKTVKKLIKQKLIDVIATDTHNMDKRPSNLLEAKNHLKKYYESDALDLLFNRIQL
jgi:protein-tyrosine phosphatase